MIEKLDMKTPDFTNENIAQIAALFPNCVTEMKDNKGNTKKVIDFDLLKQELSENIIDGVKERYSLNWPGKKEALVTANKPINKTLRPDVKDSVNFDTTQNLYIEGDNLEALKLLQESYLNKIKMIYIDPPYNTGKDFVYKDNFTGDKDLELEKSGQISEEGRLVANLESNGRYHSDWLTMMYPRLKLARNLLKEDGVIFISIDDNEVHNLRKVCDEVFGEDNFVSQLIWNNEGNIDNQSKIKNNHEYILFYVKNIDFLEKPNIIDPNITEDSKLFNNQIENSITKNGPANPPSKILLPTGFPTVSEEITIDERSDKFPYINKPIISKNYELVQDAEVESGWSSKNLLELYIKNGCQPILDSEGKETWFAITDTGAIYVYKKRSNDQSHFLSVLRNFGTTKQNSGMLNKWGIKFSYPKPVYLMEYLINSFSKENELFLDFFSGSGTTAHAVMNVNSETNKNIKFISVQLPEKIDDEKFTTISELGRERIKQAGKNLLNKIQNKNLDIGFRTLKIDSSNMNDIYYTPDEITQDSLFDITVDNIKEGRTSLDLLFQVLLDSGIDLTLPIRSDKILDKEVFFVDENVMVACFEDSIDEALVTEIAKMDDILKVVFKDSSFKSDDMRINVEQIFKQYSPDTDLKVI